MQLPRVTYSAKSQSLTSLSAQLEHSSDLCLLHPALSTGKEKGSSEKGLGAGEMRGPRPAHAPCLLPEIHVGICPRAGVRQDPFRAGIEPPFPAQLAWPPATWF